jgi:putative transcriptional regulator
MRSLRLFSAILPGPLRTGDASRPPLRRTGTAARCIAMLCLAGLIGLCLAPAARAGEGAILLIADPGMASPLFSRSVVLVIPHGRGAAVGLILNQPIPQDAATLYPGDSLLRRVGKLYYGGPVDADSVVFLFRSIEAPEDALHVLGDVYISNDRELLAEQLRRPRAQSALQVYAGYAGWTPGQLQMEIMHGAWSTREADLELLLETDRESLWEELTTESVRNWF